MWEHFLMRKAFLTCNKDVKKKTLWALKDISFLYPNLQPSDLANYFLLLSFFYKVDKMFSSSRNSIFQAGLNFRALPQDVLLICH